MKTFAYLLTIAMFFFAGCAKDAFFTDEEDMNLKSAEVKMIPMKAEFYSVPTEVDEYGLMKAGYLEGNFTHLGKLNPDLSTFVTTNVEFLSETIVKFWMEGQLGAANGDLLYCNLVGTIDVTTGHVEADVNYTGGTGRLEKYTGNAHFTGQLNPETGYVYCTLEGILYK